jgi:large subunit ribosomal protein L7/L12
MPEKQVAAEKKTKDADVVDSKVDEILTSIEEMTLLQVSKLVKALEERFGVTAAAPVTMAAMGAPAAGGAAPAAEAEEKTEFDVVLKSAGAQ